MDENSTKRSKLDTENLSTVEAIITEDDDISTSNVNKVNTIQSIPMDIVDVTVPNEEIEIEDAKISELSGINTTTAITETDIAGTSKSSDEISGCSKKNLESENNHDNDSDVDKKENKESIKVEISQNNITELTTNNEENNEPGTSSQSQQQNDQNNEEKKSDDKSSNNIGGEGRKSGSKRRNYRARVVSSSSDDSDDDDGNVSAQGTTGSSADLNIALSRRRRIFLSSSSISESDSNSDNDAGGIHANSDSSDSTSIGDLESMDYDDSNSSSSNHESGNNTPHEILQSNKKPDYKWSSSYEIMYREHGLSGRGRQSLYGRNANSFQNGFYSSRHTVEKLKLLHKLEKHQGCVNSLNFNKAGSLLVSGSDDLKIVIWNWALNKVAYFFKSGHTSNVFQTKFVDLSGSINIVSSGRDGQVRHATVPPSGGKVMSSVLLKHDGAVHKLTPTHNPYEILTAGEDGHVVHFDLREPPVQHLVTVKMNKRKVPLYSIAHHPFDQEFCVCGRNQFVYVYDRRNTKKPAQLLYPKHLEDKKPFVSHITCAVYNSTGDEILASYSDEDIYLFNNKYYIPGTYLHQYRGHNNRKTIKGVNFFGLNSEYIISGSDCGNFFIWDKETESIINWLHGDRGVVNCLEPHPSFPVLATSGLDSNIKIWMPLNDEYPPAMEGIEKCIKHNTKRSMMPEHDLFDDRTLFFFVHECLRNRRPAQTAENCPYVQDLVSTSSSSDDEHVSGSDEDKLRTLPCSPQ